MQLDTKSDDVDVGLFCIVHNMRFIKKYNETVHQVHNLTTIICLL